MFMADLCYIFIYIIKWFLKSATKKKSNYENNCNWSMPTVEQIWWKTPLLHRISIFDKETSKSNMTVSNNSINIGIAWAWNIDKHW